jgi:hypothetical protein
VLGVLAGGDVEADDDEGAGAAAETATAARAFLGDEAYALLLRLDEEEAPIGQPKRRLPITLASLSSVGSTRIWPRRGADDRHRVVSRVGEQGPDRVVLRDVDPAVRRHRRIEVPARACRQSTHKLGAVDGDELRRRNA